MQFIKSSSGIIQRQSFFKTNTRKDLYKRAEGGDASKFGTSKKRGKGGMETNASLAKKNYRSLDQDEHNWEELLIKITSPFPARKVSPEQEQAEEKIRKDYEKGEKQEQEAAFEHVVAMNKRRDLAIKALPPVLMANANKKVEEREVFNMSYWQPRDQFHIPGPKDYPPSLDKKPSKFM
eukprot:TRINITY_DN12703_c0_g1_i1.p1 TRINITY_DN12703_c0_g1~~TRINITY_DN12703_c0_g1_i1.p1  ORF type:complete len:179 (-),score=37.65 TRINITY_DN12703_c0_g1_i1:40-576(-)